MAVKQAIILAGGLGTRLRSAVPDLPKCMAPVCGKPFLHYVIRYFHQQGIEKFIFSLGYKHEMIEEYLDKELPAANYVSSIEEEPLGTGGAIKLACSRATGKTVLVLNGDTLFKVNVSKLTAFHDLHRAECTLSLKPMNNFDRYGVVELSPDHSIKDFCEKTYYKSGLINGGVYALDHSKFVSANLPEKFSFEKDYLEKLYARRKIFGVAQDEYFIDIGIPEDYERAQLEMKNEP
ncbi:MAG: nucleotidyltransferase family protein [Bacteroidetes bacterium]|nr:nucleotidyltransferase family protein [Bacteroidota bacterium]MBS1974037.1 nucleotidyltransferase family protein [Bacteroidota bacterium]